MPAVGVGGAEADPASGARSSAGASCGAVCSAMRAVRVPVQVLSTGDNAMKVPRGPPSGAGGKDAGSTTTPSDFNMLNAAENPGKHAGTHPLHHSSTRLTIS